MISKKDKQGYAVMAGVGALLLGILIIMALNSSKAKAAADNCVGEPSSSSVIVLDHSEAISEQTREEIIARAMTHIRDKVQVNERVSIFTISDLTRRSLKPLLSLCRPPEDGNRLTENVKIVQKRFAEKFAKPVREALSRTPDGAKESPIAQALTDISLSQYLKGQQSSLLIFSDMLEHTSKFSMYGCAAPADVIKKYCASRVGAQERPVFRNTAVSLNLIPRLNQSRATLKCRDTFWPWFFGDNEGAASSLNVEYLPGGV